MKKMICSVLLIFVAIVAYMQLPMFGHIPSGIRLEQIRKSLNYQDDHFCNIHNTSVMVRNPLKSMSKFLFKNRTNLAPPAPLPSIRTDLHSLNPREDVLVWFGHSSYFVQIDGIRILVDPLFSEVSSPLLFFPRAFAGSNIYKPEDIPNIDYLIITHDHWDHLDYETVCALKDRIRTVVCPLGVGEHLEYWGFRSDRIIEMDWNSDLVCSNEFSIYCLPARHFSGRGIFRNKALWASFLIQSNGFKIYFCGDSGYDTHFAEIGSRFGGVDVAMLDSGQHDPNWHQIHMMTDEVVLAARDLGTKILIPAHICKLSLANHAWDEPLKELTDLVKYEHFQMVIPMIGEKIDLHARSHPSNNWWKSLEQ